MATWVIGDVHGCDRTLRALLERIGWDRCADRLWFTGDLVNRGPGSLAVLRWVVEHQDRVTMVLGNHDLYLLARDGGVTSRERRDTLDDLLNAEDARDLVAWLRARPLVHLEDGVLLVHAGLWPSWGLAKTVDVGAQVAAALRGRTADRLLGGLLDGRVLPWDDSLPAREKARRGAAILTNIRTVDVGGECPRSGAVADRAENRPWHETSAVVRGGATVVFGHWAQQGFVRRPGVLALDTGCVWGGGLTAVRLDDGELVTEPTRENRDELPPLPRRDPEPRVRR